MTENLGMAQQILEVTDIIDKHTKSKSTEISGFNS